MKAAYPIIMTKGKKWIIVTVPDFDINTQGTDYADAMYMARDAIGLMGITLEDDGEAIPAASDMETVMKDHAGEGVVTVVDVDFTEYRRANDMRTVRRNVSLPNWLNVKAEQSGINVSAVLQKALKAELGIA